MRGKVRGGFCTFVVFGITPAYAGKSAAVCGAANLG